MHSAYFSWPCEKSYLRLTAGSIIWSSATDHAKVNQWQCKAPGTWQGITVREFVFTRCSWQSPSEARILPVKEQGKSKVLRQTVPMGHSSSRNLREPRPPLEVTAGLAQGSVGSKPQRLRKAAWKNRFYSGAHLGILIWRDLPLPLTSHNPISSTEFSFNSLVC